MTKLLYNSRQVVVQTIKKIKSESIQISEITKAHVLCEWTYLWHMKTDHTIQSLSY